MNVDSAIAARTTAVVCCPSGHFVALWRHAIYRGLRCDACMRKLHAMRTTQTSKHACNAGHIADVPHVQMWQHHSRGAQPICISFSPSMSRAGVAAAQSRMNTYTCSLDMCVQMTRFPPAGICRPRCCAQVAASTDSLTCMHTHTFFTMRCGACIARIDALYFCVHTLRPFSTHESKNILNQTWLAIRYLSALHTCFCLRAVFERPSAAPGGSLGGLELVISAFLLSHTSAATIACQVMALFLHTYVAYTPTFLILKYAPRDC